MRPPRWFRHSALHPPLLATAPVQQLNLECLRWVCGRAKRSIFCGFRIGRETLLRPLPTPDSGRSARFERVKIRPAQSCRRTLIILRRSAGGSRNVSRHLILRAAPLTLRSLDENLNPRGRGQSRRAEVDDHRLVCQATDMHTLARCVPEIARSPLHETSMRRLLGYPNWQGRGAQPSPTTSLSNSRAARRQTPR